MNSDYSKQYSAALGHEMEMLSFGQSGIPVVLFPTSMGHFAQYRDSGLIDTASWFIEEGKVRIYCPDSYDAESWYNKSISPWQRVQNYLRYAQMFSSELLPRIQHETGHDRVILGGCSFGGYHAANLAFRHPESVSYLFSMSGMFDIRPQLDGYYDQDVYYNNPIDYVPGLHDPNLKRMGIALGVGQYDICLASNQQMANLLDQKEVSNWLDIVPGATHDWPVWRQMFPYYLSKI